MTPEQLEAYWKLGLKVLSGIGLVVGLILIISSETVRSRRDRKPLKAIGVVLAGASMGTLIALLLG